MVSSFVSNLQVYCDHGDIVVQPSASLALRDILQIGNAHAGLSSSFLQGCFQQSLANIVNFVVFDLFRNNVCDLLLCEVVPKTWIKK